MTTKLTTPEAASLFLELMLKQSELCNRWNALAESFPDGFPNCKKILDKAARDFRYGIARAITAHSYFSHAKDFPEIAMTEALADDIPTDRTIR